MRGLVGADGAPDRRLGAAFNVRLSRGPEHRSANSVSVDLADCAGRQSLMFLERKRDDLWRPWVAAPFIELEFAAIGAAALAVARGYPMSRGWGSQPEDPDRGRSLRPAGRLLVPARPACRRRPLRPCPR